MIWNQFCEQNIVHPDPINYGWLKEDVLKPCWFEGPQLSPCLQRQKRKRKRKEADHAQGCEIDTSTIDTKEK